MLLIQLGRRMDVSTPVSAFASFELAVNAKASRYFEPNAFIARSA